MLHHGLRRPDCRVPKQPSIITESISAILEYSEARTEARPSKLGLSHCAVQSKGRDKPEGPEGYAKETWLKLPRPRLTCKFPQPHPRTRGQVRSLQ